MLRNVDGGGGVRFSGKKALRRCMLLALLGGGWGSTLQKNSFT